MTIHKVKMNKRIYVLTIRESEMTTRKLVLIKRLNGMDKGLFVMTIRKDLKDSYKNATYGREVKITTKGVFT